MARQHTLTPEHAARIREAAARRDAATVELAAARTAYAETIADAYAAGGYALHAIAAVTGTAPQHVHHLIASVRARRTATEVAAA